MLKDVIQLICKDSGLNYGEPDVKYCFGMSKMTVIKETTNFKNYFVMREVEFFEFLVRLAHQKYQSWQQPIHVKLEQLLDELFKTINCKRLPVQIDNEEFSESDDDY